MSYLVALFVHSTNTAKYLQYSGRWDAAVSNKDGTLPSPGLPSSEHMDDTAERQRVPGEEQNGARI